MQPLSESGPGSTPQAADFGSRFSAFVVDAAMLFAVQWVVFIVLSRQGQSIGLVSQHPCQADALRVCEGPSNLLWTVLLLFLLVSTVGYYAFFEGRYGATPGKKWLGLEVVGIDGSGPIGFARSTTRAVVRQAFWLSLFLVLDASPLAVSLPPVLFLFLPAAAVALTAWGAVAADGRSAHDLAAATVVVRSNELAGAPATLSTPDAASMSVIDDSEDLV